jgi:hypothetical protein
MNAQQRGVRDRITSQPWRATTICFALLYCALLVFVFATISFSDEDAARRYIGQLAKRPPAPLPPLPVVNFIQWPDIAMRRDPFQPSATSTGRAPSEPAAGDKLTFRLVASYQEAAHAYVIGRSAAGELARYGVGDKVDGGEIERIDGGRVIFKSGGKQREVEILRTK